MYFGFLKCKNRIFKKSSKTSNMIFEARFLKTTEFKLIFIEDAMRRDTAAPHFGDVPFWGSRFVAVDCVLRMVILGLVSLGLRLCAWFFAGSWRVLSRS